MEQGSDWQVILYRDAEGRSPVREFLESLDPKTRVRFAWSIEQLRLRNVQARPPLVKHVEGKLWELREESQTNIYRLLYVFAADRQIVFLHGFQKKTDKLPLRELETAKARLMRFLREAGETDR